MTEKDKRVVITGLGIVSPIGVGVESFWNAALKGTNGVRLLTSIDTTDYKTKTGGEVLDFTPSDYMSDDVADSMGRSSRFAVAATKMALEDSGLDVQKDPFRTGVSVGTTMGEPQVLEQGITTKYNTGDANEIPRDLPRRYPCGVIPANISRAFGIKGPSTIIPTACAAGNYAVGYAYDMIRLGRIDAAVVGGSDPFSSIAFTGFNRLLATTPDVCRPFDRNRNGMAVSEGAGMMIIESLASAQARKAEIHAEILGYGLACDAFKMTIPDPCGSGGILALRKALSNAKIDPTDIDYICAHGTGTKENDKTETLIAKRVLGEHWKSVPMSSLKSMTGHTMGAASAIEACACVLMLKNQTILPTINYSEPDPDCDMDCVPNEPRRAKLKIAISNAYAFAGNTSALVLSTFSN